MKIIILAINLIILSMTCLGQQITVDSLLTVKLPDAAKKLSQPEKDAIKNNPKFAENRLAKRMREHRGNFDIFQINNVLVTLHAESGKVKDDHLADLKKYEDYTFHYDFGYQSMWKTVDNNQALMMRFFNKDVVKYLFFAFTKTTAMSGEMLFDVADEDQAKLILDDIIKNIKFIK